MEVSQRPRIFNQECLQNVRNYSKCEIFQAHGYQVLKATGLACPRHFRAHGSGKYGLKSENRKKEKFLEVLTPKLFEFDSRYQSGSRERG